MLGKAWFVSHSSAYRYNTTLDNPHRLRIDYRVQLAQGETANDYRNQENVIARSSVEVIPDASFECP